MNRLHDGPGVLRKVKLPHGGEFRYEAALLAEDEYGTWLAVPAGAAWSAPHEKGTLGFASVVLLPPSGTFVAWWVGRPSNPRLQIDIARTPAHDDLGWKFVDLELDIFVEHDGSGPVLLDEDELAERVVDGSMTSAEASSARAVAESLLSSIRRGQLPWVEQGWDHLSKL